MNQQEEMRIAIAEACGWNFDGIMGSVGYGIKGGCVVDVPNFCGSLDAIHEAEKALTYEQLEAMHQTLADVLSTWKPRNRGTAHDFMWHATAAQRAEAFCRTLKIGPFKGESKP